MINKLCLLNGLLACALVLFAPGARAEWSMNLGVTSDYLHRGLSQSSGGPSVSGGFDYEHESGFFLGAWTSSVNFSVVEPFAEDASFRSSELSLEIDLFLGFAGTAGRNELLGYSFTYIQYIYPFDNLGEFANWRGSDYGDLVFDLNVADFIFGISYTTDTEIGKGSNNIGSFNEVGDLYFYLGYSGQYEAGWSFATSLNFHFFNTDREERVATANPFFYWYIDFGVAKSTDYGQVKISISKVFNIVGSPDADYNNERSYRPVISWTSYF